MKSKPYAHNMQAAALSLNTILIIVTVNGVIQQDATLQSITVGSKFVPALSWCISDLIMYL